MWGHRWEYTDRHSIIASTDEISLINYAIGIAILEGQSTFNLEKIQKILEKISQGENIPAPDLPKGEPHLVLDL